MDSTSLPVAIQNALDYLGVGLSVKGLMTLARASSELHPPQERGALSDDGGSHPGHGEEGRLSVFNGRGGLELTDCLRAGCMGMVPAPECVDRQIRIYELMEQGGSETETEKLRAGSRTYLR